MKVTVTMPVALVRAADRLARRRKRSRSVVISAAVADYVARRDPEALTEAHDLVAEGLEASLDGFGLAAAGRLLRRLEW